MDLEEQYDKIFHYCCFKMCDRQLAQDITQETFLRFYRRGLKLESGKMLPYLYATAKNLCLDEFRKKPVSGMEDLEEKTVCDSSEEIIDNLALRAAMARLPAEDQELLFLRYVHEVSVTSICKIAGISRFAVYRRLARASKQLREELIKEGFTE